MSAVMPYERLVEIGALSQVLYDLATAADALSQTLDEIVERHAGDGVRDTWHADFRADIAARRGADDAS